VSNASFATPSAASGIANVEVPNVEHLDLTLPLAVLYVTSSGDACSEAHQEPDFALPNLTTLALIFPVAWPPPKGGYAIGNMGLGPATNIQGLLSADDANACHSRAVATGGTVTLTSSGTSGIAGTFEVTFASGTFSGRFDAPFCDFPSTARQGTTASPAVCGH
jgi:hypothetical protein